MSKKTLYEKIEQHCHGDLSIGELTKKIETIVKSEIARKTISESTAFHAGFCIGQEKYPKKCPSTSFAWWKNYLRKK